MSGRKTFLTSAMGWALFGILLALEYHLFPRLTGVPFFTWFRESAGAAYLGFAVVSWAINLDRFPGLVSRHPFEFLRTYFIGLTYVFAQWATFLGQRPAADNVASRLADLVDALLTSLFGLLLILACVAWLVLVAPTQYFVFLVAGAPARAMMGSPEWLSVRESGPHTTLTVTEGERAPDQEKLPRDKPVTLTNAIAPAVVWLLRFA